MRMLNFLITLPGNQEGYIVGSDLNVSGTGINAKARIISITTAGIVARIVFDSPFGTNRYFTLLGREDGGWEFVIPRRANNVDVNLGHGASAPTTVVGLLIGS